MSKNPATLSDIAKRLNISVSTVSRALNNHPAISQETKRKVKRIADELKYEPNILALNLLRKRTNTIGVIVPEITSYFFSSVIGGIQDMISTASYQLIIGQSEESLEKERGLLQAFEKIRVDGLLISPTSETINPDFYNELIKQGTPLVLFDRDCVGTNADRVLVDDYSGAFQAVEYLIKTGCRHIAHISGPKELSISAHRLAGYQDAMKKYDLTINDNFIINTTGFKPEDGVEATRQLLKSANKPDAIFAINDGIAIGSMYVLKEAGIAIPDQISVVGFDDEPHSSYFMPSLTSVWQPVYDMGLLAARILLGRINESGSQSSARYEQLKPELIIRDSSRRVNNG